MNKKLFYPYYRGTFTHWDNSPRRNFKNAINPHVFDNPDPELFKSHLQKIVNLAKKDFKENENLIFINAWNEWGEGAILEPDNIYGYDYLEIIKEVYN